MEIVTRCESCNRTLEGDLGNDGVCYTELCPTCKKRIKDEAYDEGYKEGYKDGKKGE